jgi:hypothetical protein
MISSRASVNKMAGNSMHTTVCGVIWLYVLSQIPLDPHMAKLLWQRAQRRTRQIEHVAKRQRTTNGWLWYGFPRTAVQLKVVLFWEIKWYYASHMFDCAILPNLNTEWLDDMTFKVWSQVRSNSELCMFVQSICSKKQSFSIRFYALPIGVSFVVCWFACLAASRTVPMLQGAHWLQHPLLT